jgi:hypothetical protein
VLPEGITYCRGKGFGTAKLGLLYEISRQSHGSKPHLVPLVGSTWNQIVAELRTLGDIAREFFAPRKSDSAAPPIIGRLPDSP